MTCSQVILVLSPLLPGTVLLCDRQDYLVYLCFSFIICKMGTVPSASQGFREDEMRYRCIVHIYLANDNLRFLLWLSSYCNSTLSSPFLCRAAVPSLFGTRGCFRGRQFFHGPGLGGGGFGMIQVHYIYCALYFYYYYIVTYNEIIMQLTVMQNQWEPWAHFHLPLTDRVLMSLQAADWWWSLCSQTSLLMIICICSRSPALASPPQLHLRSSGIRFSWGAHSLDPSHAQFTVVFTLLWESNAADLTGGGAQVVMWAMGSGC